MIGGTRPGRREEDWETARQRGASTSATQTDIRFTSLGVCSHSGSSCRQSLRVSFFLIALVRQMTNARQLAEAALRIYLERESKILASEMARVQEEATTKLNIMFGQQHSQWSQADLHDYDFLKDSIDVSQLSEHLPGIAASFRSQYFDIASWREAAKNCETILSESEAASNAFLSEADAEWRKMTVYFAAVDEAESHYEFIVVERDGAWGNSSRSSSE